ncbi:MAG TPA: asparagine synthase (glutamine-hydrolyzing), partial [Candidatus Acidoferrales bacterium]|nr:asparagine synthase (glutamine-hydrolyzing) [Candidatus Acidoferrales bacterium]
MCGIAGLMNGGSAELLGRMNDIIAHRGPDDAGLKWFDDACSGMAQRRLSIIDLSPGGHQPMRDDTGDLWIVFNGEIYNYKELGEEVRAQGVHLRSSSDTEILLYAYKIWGEDCLQKLNGMFAFAIYDVRKRKLFAARDRLGIKPFYYHFENGRLVFASEIKAILNSTLVPKRPDLNALHTPARFQVSPLTGFEDILKLPPAHCLTLEDSQLSVRQYWGLHPTEQEASEDVLIEQLDALLCDSVRLQMRADVPVGVFLSGGLDSSIISALMRVNTQQTIHSFTIKFSDEDQKFEQMTPDWDYARQVAKQFGFTYHEIEIHPQVEELLPKMVWHLDEPLSDPAAINTYLISKAARDLDIVVLLNGMGGDEVFGGYRKHLACLTAESYQSIVPGMVRNMVQYAADRIPVATSSRGLKQVRWGKRFLSIASLPRGDRFLMSDLSVPPNQFSQMFASRMSYYDSHFFKAQGPRFKSNGISYLTQMCLNDTLVFLPEHNLTYSDKASMAASIESRPPLTDHRIVEFMFSVPPRERIHRTTQKYLLKKVAEKYLPENIIYRPKAPFASPLRSWVRGPLSTMVADLLSEESLRARGLYDPAYVSGLIARDKQGLEDNAYQIWT